MLDHVTIGVSDFERSKKFYDSALRPLGIMRLYGDGERFAGYGVAPKAIFWIGIRETAQTGAHIAFVASERATVDRFYEEAIAAGGRDNGRPGIRPHYDPDYYDAFVIDPDGHNIEAVCRASANDTSPISSE
jgi:catechol 2,3-dioxygenase-like lactoylglutathione lyase family enzyme